MKKTILSTSLIVALVGPSCTNAVNDQGRVSPKQEAVIATVNVGRYPHGVAVNEDTHRI